MLTETCFGKSLHPERARDGARQKLMENMEIQKLARHTGLVSMDEWGHGWIDGCRRLDRGTDRYSRPKLTN